jgi:hypothetical protein
MNPRQIEVEIRANTNGMWSVYVNSVRVVRFFKIDNARDYIEDLKELNQDCDVVLLNN